MQLRNLILRELLEWGPPTIKPDQFVQGLIAELRNKPLICTLLGIERSMEADLGEAIDLGQCEIDDKTLAISAIRGIVAGKIIEFFQTGLAAGEVGSDTQYVYTHYEIYPGFKEKRFLLETLGREAVKLACSDDLFHRYPDANEGGNVYRHMADSKVQPLDWIHGNTYGTNN